MSSPLHARGLAALAAGLAKREFSSVELTRHLLDRLEAAQPQLNAMISITGEAALAAAAREWLAGCPTIADLFSGLGTFAFALAGPAKVLAAEAARDAHLACKAAAGAAQLPVFAMHRDLFRNPLQPDELDRFAGVVLDPPRAGARDQVGRIAESRVPRVVYVSCNPSSWARDAATLVASGYRLEEVRPVGQFRWSTHVELASLFVR